MISRSSSLTGRLPKRIFVCFLLASVLPTAGLAIYAYNAVAADREEDTRKYLQRELTAIRMGSLDRLKVYRDAFARALERRPRADRPCGGPADGEMSTVEAIEAPRGFRRVLLVPVPDVPEDLRTSTASPVRRAARAVADAGRDGFVIVTPTLPSSDRATLYMGKQGAPGPNLRCVIVGEIDPANLWSHLSADKLGTLELAIENADGGVLFRSGDSPASAAAGEPVFQESALLFLEPMFGAGAWTFRIRDQRSALAGPLRQFEVVFPLSVALTLAIVLLLSLHLVRRTLQPLQQLQRGAERIAEGDLDVRVAARSGDELEALAATFNTMAERLGRHVGLIETVNWIDEAMLGGGGTHQVTHRVLEGVCRYAGAGRAALIATDEGGVSSVTIHDHRSGGPEEHDRLSQLALTGEIRGWLDETSRPGAIAYDDLPPALAEAATSGREQLYCLPVGRQIGVRGVVLVSDFGDPGSVERVSRMDRLVTRVEAALQNARMMERLSRMGDEAVEALARAIDATSSWTAGHSLRVTSVAMAIGRELRLDEAALGRLYRGSMLHDVGKLGVPKEILEKSGSLTGEEMTAMRRHCRLGATILGPLSAFRDVVPIVEQHHERFDGSGYPGGLAGQEILLEARILAVADVFDALSSARPYRDEVPVGRVVEMIRAESGSHFDPHVVDAFVRLYSRGDLPSVASRRELQESAAAARVGAAETAV